MSEKWKTPPVFYALAQVQFNAIAEHKFADDIQDAFRQAGFPDAVLEQQVQLSIEGEAGGATPPRFTQQLSMRRSFMDAQKGEGFVWLPNALTYHTTRYQNFEHFQAQFQKGLEVMAQVTRPDYVERVGSRYLDLVVPTTPHALSRYLVPQVLGLSESNPGEGHSMCETVSRKDTTTLISRVFIAKGEGQAAPLPAEMGLLHLQMAERFQVVTGAFAVLDTDCYELLPREAFDPVRIVASLARVKTRISNTFSGILTDEAKKEWQ